MGHPFLSASLSAWGAARQGDFVVALMEGLGRALGGRAGGLSQYVLAGRLDAAVRASSAQFDDPDTLARLRVRLTNVGSSSTGAAVLQMPNPWKLHKASLETAL